MNIGRGIERAMAMSDATWARHANPLSVWTRVPVLPALLLALYSYWWIGLWCLVPTALLVAWTFINPRAFPPPANRDNWASRATFGERVWLNRAAIPIPGHHEAAARILTALSALGLPFAIYGLIVREPWAVVAGCAISMAAKLWFCDRMVWLYQDMKSKSPAYEGWLKRQAAGH